MSKQPNLFLFGHTCWCQDLWVFLYDINHSKFLYDPPPRVLEIKTKINKWDLIKLKRFFTAKETISKVKRQPSEWEKITANETSDKELIPGKQTTQSKSGKKT